MSVTSIVVLVCFVVGVIIANVLYFKSKGKEVAPPKKD